MQAFYNKVQISRAPLVRVSKSYSTQLTPELLPPLVKLVLGHGSLVRWRLLDSDSSGLALYYSLDIVILKVLDAKATADRLAWATAALISSAVGSLELWLTAHATTMGLSIIC